jgi:hypothetical protein
MCGGRLGERSLHSYEFGCEPAASGASCTMPSQRTHASCRAVLILTVSLTIVGGTTPHATQAPSLPDNASRGSTPSALIGT